MADDGRAGDGEGAAFEEIPRSECLDLLSTQIIGRVAVADFEAAPLVVPVNFVADGESVVFRTDYGSKFRLAVTDQRPMSFEVDGIDPGRRSGWSVLLRGMASEVEEVDRERLSIDPWVPGAKHHWIRLVPESITGRRLRLVGGDPDGRGYL